MGLSKGSVPSMTNISHYSEIVQRIEAALTAARRVFDDFTPGAVAAEYKAGHDPVTEADKAVNAVLQHALPRGEEGWFSEESTDDLSRLKKRALWIVDPLDGTREFVAGVPEFCISIAYVEDQHPVAGGICNPATREIFVGARGLGVTYNGQPARVSSKAELAAATILASRSETKRGEWKQFERENFNIQPMGSVAYKLALVSAGLADATFTLVPKHEWDVAAGAALVESAGGFVRTLENQPLRCNQISPLISGLVAGGIGLQKQLLAVALKGRDQS